MLTRLQIDGFKNLRSVDLRFGPLTCVAGRNGVGKSNLFDAISFLSNLASMPLVTAGTRVRGTGGRISAIPSLFAPSQTHMRLVADMVVPRQVQDDFDRPATATATYMRYSVELGLPSADATEPGQPLVLLNEDLRALSLEAALQELRFGPDKTWVKRFLKGPGSRTSPFIHTDGGAIKLWGDQGRGGRQAEVPAAKSPQTVLASVGASTHPTALAVRREMQSWRQLQLEPSALRAPDDYRDDDSISHSGAHLPNALRRIGCQAELSNQLANLIPGVISVDVDSDDARQQRLLKVRLQDRRTYDASALSDGTLRFIALALLGLDPLTTGLTCLEEPENGIHPQRIPAMMALVQKLAEDLVADDPEDRISEPFVSSPRQVMINTHSPLVFAALPEHALLMADTRRQGGQDWVTFKPMAGTWRAADLPETALVSKGLLAGYLGAHLSSRKSNSDPSTDDMFRSR
ncbi:MAG: AAA family ATPase [Pseudomonadota bacterium]